MTELTIKTEPTIKNVAVVGTGVIGRSWIQVFARAGCRTRAYDRDPALVHTRLHAGVAERAPSPAAFDHIIAKVSSGNRDYWFDATAIVNPARARRPMASMLPSIGSHSSADFT